MSDSPVKPIVNSKGQPVEVVATPSGSSVRPIQDSKAGSTSSQPASGGKPASNPSFTGNKTLGRIKTMQAPPPRPGLDGETDAKYGDKYDRLKHLSDEWNSDKPLLEKGKRLLHALDYTVPDAEAKRQAMIDAINAENARWATNDAIASSPLSALLTLGGHAFSADPATIDKLAQTGQVIGGVLGSGAAARTGINPLTMEAMSESRAAARQAPRPRTQQQPAPPKQKENGGTYVEKAPLPPPKVTATAKVNGQTFKGTNQQARENPDANRRTAAAERIEADKRYKPTNPNTNMANAHAEIEAMQKAYDAGITKGADMTIELTGQNMCTFCRSNVATMANEIGLNSLEVYGPNGELSTWARGSGWTQKGWK